MISIIVATAHHNVIGKANALPWYLPADLRHFKEVTMGHTVVMGRKTFNSIIKRLGKPLPNRTNVVITREKNFTYNNVIVMHDFSEVLKIAQNQELFIIGGAEVYATAIPYTDKIYLTEIDADEPGDTYFPQLKKSAWRESARQTFQKDEKNPYNYSFVTLMRR